MKASELQEIFGAPVLVQFREAVALVEGGAMQQYMPLSPLAQPTFAVDEKGFRPVGAMRPQAKLQRDNEGPVFTLTLEAMILPSSDPERVQVCYHAGEQSVTMYLRPADILAVSVISEKPTKGLISKP